MRDIAKHYGVGETTVWAKIKEFGIKFRGNESGNGHKRKRPPRTEEHSRKIGQSRTGKYVGEKAGNWKGGVAQVHNRLRQSNAYQTWKKQALALRGNKCQQCGVEGGKICECCGTSIKLHVHHVKSFAKYPETRFDPENSEVLCPSCHHSRHRCKSS